MSKKPPFLLLKSSDQQYWLRSWKKSDIDNLTRHANNKNIADNLTDMFPNPYTRENGEKFIQTIMEIDPPRILCISENDQAIGAIGIHPQADIWCKNMEMGYWLAEEFWGKGIITQAVKNMVSYGFQTFDVERIFARPFGRNEGSIKVLEKVGFELEAHLKNTIFKNGKFEDELIYAIRRSH